MKSSSSYHLAQPPRPVPWPIRAQLFLGSGANQIGWVVAGFGMIFFWIFGLNSDIAALWFALSSYETTPGVISDIQITNASENDTPVYANHYIFRVEREEQEFRGMSYTTGMRFAVGESVPIQYLSRNPEVSRIEGTRSALFSGWLACLIGLFPGAGIGLIGYSLWQGIKHQRLLAEGQVGSGRLRSAEPTNTRINEQTVYKLTFEFTAADGQSYTVVTRTHVPQPLQDEAEEQLLYDPAKPSRAVMLDRLPGEPDIDEWGHLQAKGTDRTLRLLFLPLAVLLIHGGILLMALMN